MSDNAFGILIIIGFIIIAIVSGGAIFKPAKNDQKAPGAPEAGVVNQNSPQPQYNPPQPIQGKVRIVSIYQPGTLYESVMIQSDYYADNINLTGWKLRSAVTGNQFEIGKAAVIPVIGVKNETPLILQKNNTLVLTQNPSPVGVSFRLNKCTGYFEQDKDFQPQLPRRCPWAGSELPPLSNLYNENCLNYIKQLPPCTTPHPGNFPDNISLGCKEYITNNYNYNACVQKHASDKDFFDSEWRIYGGKTKILWRSQYEKIELIDSLGKVVDTYTIN